MKIGYSKCVIKLFKKKFSMSKTLNLSPMEFTNLAKTYKASYKTALQDHARSWSRFFQDLIRLANPIVPKITLNFDHSKQILYSF